MRRIVTAPSRPSWWPVVALALVGRTLFFLEFDVSGVSLSLSRTAITVALMLYGIAVVPFLLAFLGKWVGGNAELNDVRQAIAWSLVPTTIASLCRIPLAFALVLARPDADASELDTIVLQTMRVGQLWSLSLMISTLAEVQRFSSIRAIACIVVVSIPSLFLVRLLSRLLL